MLWVIYILGILCLVRLAESYRKKNLTLICENQLRALRNQLRLQAIDNPKIANHPSFSTIDAYIAQTEPVLNRVNLWIILYEVFVIKRKSDRKPIDFKGNSDLKKFYDDYINLYLGYLLRKNIFVLALSLITVNTTKKVSTGINLWLEGTKNKIRDYLAINQQSGYSPF